MFSFLFTVCDERWIKCKCQKIFTRCSVLEETEAAAAGWAAGWAIWTADTGVLVIGWAGTGGTGGGLVGIGPEDGGGGGGGAAAAGAGAAGVGVGAAGAGAGAAAGAALPSEIIGEKNHTEDKNQILKGNWYICF